MKHNKERIYRYLPSFIFSIAL